MSHCIIIVVIIMYQRIRDIREDDDKTQKEIADYLSCDRSLYSRYERGGREIPLRFMIKLAKYYKTSIDYLAGITDEKTPYPPTKSKKSIL